MLFHRYSRSIALSLSLLTSPFVAAHSIDDVRALEIIGGQPIVDNDQPWQVSLQSMGQHFCVGSLIAPQWVMTAAHCVADYVYDSATFESLDIRAGVTDLSDTTQGVYAKAAAIFMPIELDGEESIAIINLKEPITDIPYLSLADERVMRESGWYITDEKDASRLSDAMDMSDSWYLYAVSDGEDANLSKSEVRTNSIDVSKDAYYGDNDDLLAAASTARQHSPDFQKDDNDGGPRNWESRYWCGESMACVAFVGVTSFIKGFFRHVSKDIYEENKGKWYPGKDGKWYYE